MSYREFLDWQIYYQDEPFLADRLELQIAKLGQVTSMTGMVDLGLPNDFFIMSRNFKNTLEEPNIEEQIKTIFGVE